MIVNFRPLHLKAYSDPRLQSAFITDLSVRGDEIQ